MAEYQAPLRDLRFVLNEVLDANGLWASLDGVKNNIDPDTVDAILEEGAKITANLIAPLNRVGDEQGCSFADGQVTTPEGFKAAYQTFCEGGWGARYLVIFSTQIFAQ